MASLLSSELVELTRALEKAAAAPATPAPAEGSTAPVAPVAGSVADLPRALDILRSMAALPKVTAEELRVTKAGILVARLSKSTHAEMASLAKELVTKWKSQVLPPTPATGVEQAKAAASAAAIAKATEARKASEAAAAKSAGSDDEREQKKKRKAEKAAEKEKDQTKKAKDSSASPSPTPALSKGAKVDTSLAAQHPELTKGPHALFRTEDPLRDKMQLILHTALGEPPAAALQAVSAQRGGQDLSQYVPSKSAGTPSLTAAASPSPPPIANITLSTPTPADGSSAGPATTPASAAPESSAPAPAAPAASTAPSTSPQPPAVPTIRSRIELANAIEAAMFKLAGQNANSAVYKQKYRDLAPQLKDPANVELNVDLYLGRITPEALVSMSLAALAPSAMKEMRSKEAAWNREEVRCDLVQESASTDMFLCEMCKERKCTFFQQQTRGADEPMTIFVTCLNCGHKFRSGDGER